MQILSTIIYYIRSTNIQYSFELISLIFSCTSVRLSIQSIIDELKTHEHQLIETISQEERARLKQLETLQQDVTMASSLLSSLISQSRRLIQATDDLGLMKQIKDYHQVEEKMKESVKRVNQELMGVEKMRVKNEEEMVEMKELDGMVEEMKKRIKSMGRMRAISVKLMKPMHMEVLID